MFRILTVSLAAFAASACTFGLSSAVDAAPFEARLVASPFPDGVYCPLDADEAGQVMVQGRDEQGESDCATLTWDPSRRLLVVVEEGEKDKPTELAMADLGDGLFLMQFDLENGADSERPYSFGIVTGMAHGAAIAFLPLPSNEKVAALAARYSGLTIATHTLSGPFMTPTLPPDAPEGAELPPPTIVHYVSAGSPADIRSLTRDLTLDTLREFVSKLAEEGIAADHGIPTLVRDTAGAVDHTLTGEQKRDIDVLLAKLLALKDS